MFEFEFGFGFEAKYWTIRGEFPYFECWYRLNRKKRSLRLLLSLRPLSIAVNGKWVL